FLKFVGEDIEVTVGMEVQVISKAVVKRQDLGGHASVMVSLRAESFASPIRPMRVTQSAWRVLQVRFQLKDRLTIAVISFSFHVDQCGKELIARPADEVGQHL